MDILRGQAMTNTNGLVLDLFQFTDEEGFFRLNPDATHQFSQLLQDVVAGRKDLSATLRGKEQGMRQRRGRARVDPIEHFDNQHSHRYTVVEIVAKNAWGLLYRISHVISQHGCGHRPGAHLNGGPQGHRRVSHHPGASQAHRRGAAGARGRPRSAARELR